MTTIKEATWSDNNKTYLVTRHQSTHSVKYENRPEALKTRQHMMKKPIIPSPEEEEEEEKAIETCYMDR
ncbi:hypothetical protein RUM43_002132 [Polyplax serrata]|uniref:Uncharacterized protein n=1 Tax=Polyplax serrata TaxID=468196 RepID=A0AAN8NU44_POLSC